MASLSGSRTDGNLRTAFARESQATLRYLWFAEQADVEGRPDVAELFRQLADNETGHAFGHLEMLAELGDPGTGEPLESTEDHLRSALAFELHDAHSMYPDYAGEARDEGLQEVAVWFDGLAAAETRQADRLRRHLADATGTDSVEAGDGSAGAPAVEVGEGETR